MTKEKTFMGAGETEFLFTQKKLGGGPQNMSSFDWKIKRTRNHDYDPFLLLPLCF